MPAPSKTPAATMAHNGLKRALREGSIAKPSTCERCDRDLSDDLARLQGHHADYSKPLDVEWLCASCHAQHHRDEARAAGVPHAGGSKPGAWALSTRAWLWTYGRWGAWNHRETFTSYADAIHRGAEIESAWRASKARCEARVHLRGVEGAAPKPAKKQTGSNA